MKWNKLTGEYRGMYQSECGGWRIIKAGPNRWVLSSIFELDGMLESRTVGEGRSLKAAKAEAVSQERMIEANRQRQAKIDEERGGTGGVVVIGKFGGEN